MQQIKAWRARRTRPWWARDWQVNGSIKEGERMVRDFSKLMLRAYNDEADNGVRTMKPHNLRSAVEAARPRPGTPSRSSARRCDQVTEDYHRLRIAELELTADYLVKVAEEKEPEREETGRGSARRRRPGTRDRAREGPA